MLALIMFAFSSINLTKVKSRPIWHWFPFNCIPYWRVWGSSDDYLKKFQLFLSSLKS